MMLKFPAQLTSQPWHILEEKIDSTFRIDANEAIDMTAQVSALVKGEDRKFLQLKRGDLYLEINEYQNALETFRLIGPLQKDSTEALVLHKLGVSFYFLDQYDSAAIYFDRALMLRKSLFDDLNIDYIRSLHNAGDSYQLFGRYQIAKDRLETSLRHHQRSNERDSFLLATTYKVLGKVCADLREYDAAEIYLQRALADYNILYQDQPWQIPSIHEDLIGLYLSQDLPERMIEHANSILAIYEEIEDKYDEDYWGVANAYNNLGIAFELLDQLDTALTLYEQSAEINRSTTGRDFFVAQNLNNMSILWRKKQEWRRAHLTIDQSIALYQQRNDIVSLAQAYHNKSEIYFEQGNLSDALELAHLAIKLLCPELEGDKFPVGGSQRFGDPMELIQYLQLTANIHKNQYVLSAEKQHLESIDGLVLAMQDILEEHLRFLVFDQSRVDQLAKTKSIFELGIWSQFEQFQLSNLDRHVYRALRFCERGKAIVLLGAIQKTAFFEQIAGDVGLVAQERLLRERIDLLRRTNHDVSKISEVTAELQQVVQNIQQQYPRYANLFRGLTEQQLKQVQNDLDSNAFIVNYFVGSEHIYRFDFSPESIAMSQKGQVDSVLRNIEYFPQSITSEFGNSDQQDRTYAQLAFDLYELLLPDQDYSGLNLMIIPDDIIGYVPFEALLSDHVDHVNFSAYPYLIKQCNIGYQYSLALREEIKNDDQMSPASTVACYAPSFQNQAISSRSGLNRLIYNEQEIRQIKSIVRSRNRKGKSANKEAFIQDADEFPILHISSHGVIDDQNPRESFIAFSQFVDTMDMDEVLYVDEIYNIKIPAELVVLSACETGVGRIAKGEGIQSLARAFFYSGTKSLITTLWQINDQSTVSLMGHFYQELKNGHTKDEALRLSKLNYISTHNSIQAHPYYWAAFIAIGRNSVVHFSQEFPYVLLIVVVGILALLLLRIKNRA